MLILFKIEATLLVIAVSGFLFFWLVDRGCDPGRERKAKQFAQNMAAGCMLIAAPLVLMMIITAIWTFL